MSEDKVMKVMRWALVIPALPMAVAAMALMVCMDRIAAWMEDGDEHR